jgi:hypothetical protein
VIHAEHRTSAHDRADADAGSHRDIGEVVESLGRAPTPFGECRAIDVGVEAHRRSDATSEPMCDVGIAPTGLAGRGDESVGGRIRAQIDGTKRRDAERTWRVLRTPAIEHGVDLQRLFAFAGGQPFDRAHIFGPGAENAHALGAAQLTPASSLVEGDMSARRWPRRQPYGVCLGEEAVMDGRGVR